MTATELHPDAIICEDCGHDCDSLDCGDVCICVEEFDEDYFEDMDRAEQDYWNTWQGED